MVFRPQSANHFAGRNAIPSYLAAPPLPRTEWHSVLLSLSEAPDAAGVVDVGQAAQGLFIDRLADERHAAVAQRDVHSRGVVAAGPQAHGSAVPWAWGP